MSTNPIDSLNFNKNVSDDDNNDDDDCDILDREFCFWSIWGPSYGIKLLFSHYIYRHSVVLFFWLFDLVKEFFF